jgi:hypothetical protein
VVVYTCVVFARFVYLPRSLPPARLSAPRQLHLHFTPSGLELWRDRRKGHANTYLFRVCLLRNGAINFNEMSVYKSQVPELKSLVFVHMHKFGPNERVALRDCMLGDVPSRLSQHYTGVDWRVYKL